MVFVCVCACMCRHICVGVCVCACMHVCERGRMCVYVSLCLWCWASCSDPTECTILSANKGPAVPPHFNRGLLQHCRLFAVELTKYFPSCSEFVSINRFVFWDFLFPLALCVWLNAQVVMQSQSSEGETGHLVLPEVKNWRTEPDFSQFHLKWHLDFGMEKPSRSTNCLCEGNISCLTDIWLIQINFVHSCLRSLLRGIERCIVLKISVTDAVFSLSMAQTTRQDGWSVIRENKRKMCVCLYDFSHTCRIDVLSQVWHTAFVLCISICQWPCYSLPEISRLYYVPWIAYGSHSCC